MYGHVVDDLSQGSIDNLYTPGEIWRSTKHQNQSDGFQNTHHSNCSLWNGHDAADADFTDYHSLIKINGEWKVVAKLFHLYFK